MFWYCDFEGFDIGTGEFIVKEIAILSSDGLQCYNYHVKNPCKYPCFPQNATTLFQFYRHRLRWDFGDYNFYEAMNDIWRKVGVNLVLVKGLEKAKFLQEHLLNVEEMEGVPAFKHLSECRNDWCDVKHGIWCARRKVHELKRYANQNSDYVL